MSLTWTNKRIGDHLRAVVLTTAGIQRTTEMNTYLKTNWAAIVELLMIRFVRWIYQSLRCFGRLINGMYATHNPLQEIRRWSAFGITP